jgi:hypothetical protein
VLRRGQRIGCSVAHEREKNEDPNSNGGACQEKQSARKLKPARHELAYLELAI